MREEAKSFQLVCETARDQMNIYTPYSDELKRHPHRKNEGLKASRCAVRNSLDNENLEICRDAEKESVCVCVRHQKA